MEDLEEALDHEAVFGPVVDFSFIEEGDDFADAFKLPLLHILPADVQSHLDKFISLDLHPNSFRAHALQAGVELYCDWPLDDEEEVNDISE